MPAQTTSTDVHTRQAPRGERIVNIGYVGRLSAEEDVRLLHAVESELDAEGLDVRFTIVGDGSEREWLTSEHAPRRIHGRAAR